jgi:hypothetical protein
MPQRDETVAVRDELDIQIHTKTRLPASYRGV